MWNSHPAEISGSLSNGTEPEFHPLYPQQAHDCHLMQHITETQEVQSDSFVSDILNCLPVFGEISTLGFYHNCH